MNAARTILAAYLALAGIGSASAQPAGQRVSGATIELLAARPSDDGRIRGAILLDLEPGWKTYWIDPNGPGLAPSFDFSGSDGVDPPQLRFPAPKRLDENGDSFVGYDEPLAIAFETQAAPNATLDVSLMIGICQTLCVPVSAELRRDLETAATMDEAAIIDRAMLAALPDTGAPVEARIEGGTLLMRLPGEIGRPQDLFPAAPAGWDFGVPSFDADGEARLPILRRPDEANGARIVIEAVALGESGVRSLAVEAVSDPAPLPADPSEDKP